MPRGQSGASAALPAAFDARELQTLGGASCATMIVEASAKSRLPSASLAPCCAYQLGILELHRGWSRDRLGRALHAGCAANGKRRCGTRGRRTNGRMTVPRRLSGRLLRTRSGIPMQPEAVPRDGQPWPPSGTARISGPPRAQGQAPRAARRAARRIARGRRSRAARRGGPRTRPGRDSARGLRSVAASR
jgi:hypothetical protein